jgi:SAM-dependent methyltransferase
VEPFGRSGLATLDDLETQRWRDVFATLESVQAEFAARESVIRTGAYAWERDPLHGWSRCWEYPYHYHHLSAWLSERSGPTPTVVDLGSGVTFFPFAVARLGCDVVCVDPDPVANTEVGRAAAAMAAAPGTVRFAAGECAAIPLPDSSVDALYCVSVLEHVENPERAVPEVARVLKPGGLFVLTIDIDLIGTTAIGPEKYGQLMELLRASFDWSAPETTIHPRRVLDSFRGPYARAHEQQVPGLMWRRADNTFAPLIGGPIAADPMHLTVYAATMRRR